MPRTSGPDHSTSAFSQLRLLAQTTLNNLRRDMRNKEGELMRLKAEEEFLSHVVSTEPQSMRAGRGDQQPIRGRTNWREVLDRLPKRFKVSDVERLKSLKGRTADISAAIARWANAGLVKRKARGRYERL